MTPEPGRLSAAALCAVLVLTACGAPARPGGHSSDSVVQPVSTTLPAIPSPATTVSAETSVIVDRFSTVVWPAVVDYHNHPAQNGPAQLQWAAVIDRELDTAAWSALRDAVANLGMPGQGDDDHVPGGVESLQLASAAAASAPAGATVTACYTFTALTYTVESGTEPARTPAAAVADFSLTRTDTWYLHAITNQHSVPGC